MIICNVRGARQMLPYPDWKAEAQRGARARTNAGNNNDNDNQGGHMTSWMSKRSPTERKLRIDTRRRSQPSSRRMTTVLHKMSKKTTWKESVLLDQF